MRSYGICLFFTLMPISQFLDCYSFIKSLKSGNIIPPNFLLFFKVALTIPGLFFVGFFFFCIFTNYRMSLAISIKKEKTCRDFDSDHIEFLNQSGKTWFGTILSLPNMNVIYISPFFRCLKMSLSNILQFWLYMSYISFIDYFQNISYLGILL